MSYTNGLDDPSAYFQVATYTGNAGNQTITNDGNSDLQPDVVWIKSRTFASVHLLQDSTRGDNGTVYYYLQPNNNLLESVQSDGDGITSLNSDGFSLGFGNSNSWNQSGNTYVGWQWKANGGTTSSNTDGDITSTVQADTTAGFSIMTYAGTTGDVHTIGHGLGVTPDVWIVKQRSNGGSFQDWFFWHKDMAASNVGDNRMWFLNKSDAVGTYTGINAVTSSTIRVKSSTTAQNGYNYVAYAFAEKQGYSKFGKYIGNGSTNGPFVYTGFKPALIITKNADATDSWNLLDNKRSPYNVADKYLQADNANTEGTYTFYDILSNGFKIRNTGNANISGNTIIYMAFAENPFVTSTGTPTTAR